MPDVRVVKCADGKLRGMGADNQAKWERFRRYCNELGAGEMFTLSYRKPRNEKLHRKFFVMLEHAFEHWEPHRGRKRMNFRGRPIAKDFDKFREEVTILAGFYEQSFDLAGRMSLRAKSIAWDSMDDEEFTRLYEAVKGVLLEHVFNSHYTDAELERVVEQLQRF